MQIKIFHGAFQQILFQVATYNVINSHMQNVNKYFV